MHSKENTALTLLNAAYLLVADRTQDINSAIRHMTKAQSDVAKANTTLQSAARAIDKAEPFLKKSPQGNVTSVEQFRKFYGEITTKLNDLTTSLGTVNSELMSLTAEPAPAPTQQPAQPAAPAPAGQPGAK